MKKVIVILGILLLVLPVTLFAGAAQEEPQGEMAEEVEPKFLRIRSVAWLTRKAFISEAAEAFMKRYPDTKIEFESFADADVQKLMIQWSAGKSDTDIAVVQDPSGTTGFIIKDLIYSFDELGLWDEFDKEKLLKSFLDIATVNDKVYYLPIMGEIYWFNLNKIFLREAGLVDDDGNVPAPKNWDEIYDMARKLKAVTVDPPMSINFMPRVPYFIMHCFYGQLKGLKGTMFESDGTTLLVDTPESRTNLTNWKKGIDEGLVTNATMTDLNAGRKLYTAGKLAMLYESGSRWQEVAPVLGSDNVGPMPFPGGLENGANLFIAGFAIPRAAPAPKTALKFLRETYLADLYQSKMLNIFGKMPTLRSAYDFASSPGWVQMKAAAEKSNAFPQYREFNVFADGAGDLMVQYLTGKMDLDTALAEIKKVLDKIDKKIY
jgi:ABC-type glycerol-3-phosphate transport system substrate-binding protein